MRVRVRGGGVRPKCCERERETVGEREGSAARSREAASVALCLRVVERERDDGGGVVGLALETREL